MKQFYIYIYLDPRKSGEFKYADLVLPAEPFYVGKGSGTRDTDHLICKGSRNPIFKAKIAKLRSLGHQPIIHRVGYFEDEQTAYLQEEYYIGQIGSNYIQDINDGPLTNFCLKAQPPCHRGKTYEDIYGDRASEQREKRRQRQLDVGGYFCGRKHSEESKLKIRDAVSEYWRTNPGPMTGRQHSDKSRMQMSETAKQNIKKRTLVEMINTQTNQWFIALHYERFCEEFDLNRSSLDKAEYEGWTSIKSGKSKGWKKGIKHRCPPELYDLLQSKLNEKPYIGLDELNSLDQQGAEMLKRLFNLPS